MKPRCPTCEKEYELQPGSPCRPFCSERCKMIDLGRWLTEDYRITVEQTSESSDPDENLYSI